jgi:hypothetical protein
LVPFCGVTVKALPPQVVAVIFVTAGPEFTLRGNVVLLHPVAEEVKVNVVAPIDTPVTIFPPVTVATAGLLLTHVPPDAGERVVVLLPHITEAPILTTGRLFTVTAPLVLEHPVEVRVKVKVADPGAIPVTIPLLVTDATVGLLLTQIPPLEGDKVTTPFPHIAFVPTIVATGVSIIVNGSVVLLQPPAAVKVKVTIPAETLVTIPPLVTVATDGLLLIHVPPVAGDTAAVLPTQIEVLPIIATTGNAVTLREGLVWLHPVAV